MYLYTHYSRSTFSGPYKAPKAVTNRVISSIWTPISSALLYTLRTFVPTTVFPNSWGILCFAKDWDTVFRFFGADSRVAAIFVACRFFDLIFTFKVAASRSAVAALPFVEPFPDFECLILLPDWYFLASFLLAELDLRRAFKNLSKSDNIIQHCWGSLCRPFTVPGGLNLF